MLCGLLYYLGHGPADAVVLVSVTDRDDFRGLRQSPIGESQKGPLGLESKDLPSSADNCSLHERQVLTCYWVLVETENLPMGH